MKKSKIEIFSDGACSGNPGPAGFAALLRTKRDGSIYEKMFTGGEQYSTNNRAELMAVIIGFEALKKPSIVTVASDSAYVINAFNKGWIPNWQRNGWRNSRKESVENQDLWNRLLKAIEPHNVTWIKVKGHAGHPENERSDAAARAEIGKLKIPM